MSDIWGHNQTKFFYELTPDKVLNSIDKLGFSTTGRVLTLNSMENRVYDIELDSEEHIVAKFYRPGRWSRLQILDEHEFLNDLNEQEINVIAPLKVDGETLFTLDESDIYFAIFPKKGGRIPDELNDEKLEEIGRLLARVHLVGEKKKATHRMQINPSSFGLNNLKTLENSTYLPELYKEGLTNCINEICTIIKPQFENIRTHRIHGDCHRSNLIYREGEGNFLVDFDDMLTGPSVQDIWLVVPGIDEQARQDRLLLLEHYETFKSFNYEELKLIEPLRALRYIHFATWMTLRWEDPAFKQAFPYYGSDQYWSELIRDLYEQKNRIKTDPLYWC